MAVTCLGWSLMAQAQTPPSGGDLLREIESDRTRPAATLPLTVPAPQPSDQGSGPTVVVQGFHFSGATLLDDAALQAVVAPWIGRRSTLASLRRAADAVAVAYRERGYLARAYLPEQEVSAGRVRIVVVEGRLSEVRVNRLADAQRALPDADVRATVLARQSDGAPVRPNDLQRAITLLNETPGTQAASALEPGEQEGQTRLAVSIQGTPLLTANATLDNAGSLATGEGRLALNLALNSPAGHGEQYQLSSSLSAHSSYLRGGASLPLGHDGWRLSGYGSTLHYSYDLNSVGYKGDAQVLGASASYALQREARANLSVQAGAERRSFVNLVGGLSLSDKHIDAVNIALTGDRQDDLGGGGLWIYSLTTQTGQLSLDANAGDLAADQAAGGAKRQGSFQKVVGALTRVQRMDERQVLSLALSGQWASKNLDSAEKFQLSGPYGVRGYGVSEPSVDSGWLMSIDWRVQLVQGWSVVLFHDDGFGRRDAQPHAGTLNPNQFHLAATGVGLNFEGPAATQFKFSLARREGSNPTRDAATGRDADGSLRLWRLFATMTKAF